MAPSTPRIALLSTSDTDLLSARASDAAYTWANPGRAGDAELTNAVAGADLVVVRLLGSPGDLWPGLAGVRENGTPLVVLGGRCRWASPPRRTATSPRAGPPTSGSCTRS